MIVAAATFTLFAVGAALFAVLLRQLHARQLARRAAVEATWGPALLEVLTGDLAPESLTGRLTREETPYFVEFLGRFVRRLAGPERQRLLQLAVPLLPTVRRSLRARSPERRARAIDTLGVLSLPEDNAEIRAALEDPSPLVAMVAARALTRTGGAEHAEALMRHLHRFQEWRPAFLSAMLAAAGTGMAPALLATLRDRAAPARVRTVAADALARLNTAEGGDLAAGLLAGERDPELRAALLRLIARVGQADHLAAVRAELEAPEEGVRLAAVRALAALGGPEDVARLVAAVQDRSRWVAEQAARGLAAGSGREELKTLRRTTASVRAIADEVLAEGTP